VTVAVVAAFKREIAPFLADLAGCRRFPVAVGRAWSGRFSGRRVLVLVSGMGPDRAERALEALLTDRRATMPPVERVFSVGFAGALAPDLQVGDLVVADSLEWLSGPAPVSLEGAEPREAAERCHAVIGPLVTADRLVATPAAKEALRNHRQPPPLAVDMEAAAIARVAQRHGIPVLPFKVVLDRHDEALRVTPRTLPTLWIRSGLAARSLATGLRALLTQDPSPSSVPARRPLRGQTEDAADQHCRELAEGHYENFTVASRWVPEPQRRHMIRLYAYCRHVDDLGDEGPATPAERLAQLDEWHADLRRCWEGRPDHPILQAMQRSVEELDLPIDPFERLVEANRQDQVVTRYPDFAALRGYCRHSADPVGELVLGLFGAADPERIALSDRICTGLQLANFCQDVRNDLGRGRIYLPMDSLARFGVTPDALAAPEAGPEVRRLLAFEVERARSFLLEGAPLAKRVPRRLRLPLGLIVRGGLAILDRVAEADFDVLRARPTVSRRAKLAIAFRTMVAQGFGGW
jgi:squalene synthase HpnC